MEYGKLLHKGYSRHFKFIGSGIRAQPTHLFKCTPCIQTLPRHFSLSHISGPQPPKPSVQSLRLVLQIERANPRLSPLRIAFVDLETFSDIHYSHHQASVVAPPL
ncbi:hypothetical protein J5N97_002535 [Dioscorea zingiberensis]|uniref:Uncharacterized protein n=1 Tax=Dioscorea zingiberensis TaxID=325984 RepID=A0A9D5D3X6_9LILI|nr:hypothetical protein J5N97_002535 [Dioscorea zingiberensis]